MDLVSFRSSRAVRRAEVDDTAALQLHDRFGDKVEGHLLPKLRQLIAKGDPTSETVQELCTQFLASPDAFEKMLTAALALDGGICRTAKTEGFCRQEGEF